MSTQIVPFEFGGEQIRTVTLESGTPAIVLTDIAKVLGYQSAKDAGRLLREHHKGWAKVPTLGGAQQMLVVTEQGFNRLVIRSKASNAEQVQDFITDEVMPQLSRTGSYAPVAALPDLSTPEGVLMLAQTLTKTAEDLVAAKNEVAELAPKAGAWDDLASAEGDYEVADAAKMLARAGIETGQRRLFEQLRAARWTFRGSHGKWRAYQDKVDAGLLAELPQWHFHPKTGEKVIDPPQVRVTVNGLEKLLATMKPATDLGEVAS